MPTDHARVSNHDLRVPASAIFGGQGRGLQVVQHFFHENRIRQAASSLGAVQYRIDESVAYARQRRPFGQPLAANQAIHSSRSSRELELGPVPPEAGLADSVAARLAVANPRYFETIPRLP